MGVRHWLQVRNGVSYINIIKQIVRIILNNDHRKSKTRIQAFDQPVKLLTIRKLIKLAKNKFTWINEVKVKNKKSLLECLTTKDVGR